MTNPHIDAYGRRLLTSAVHRTNEAASRRLATAAKANGNLQAEGVHLEQANRSAVLACNMEQRETTAKENNMRDAYNG